MTEGHDFHEAIFREPLSLLDHVIEHHGDLRHRPTNVHKAEEEEVKKDLAPRRHLMSVAVLGHMFSRFIHDQLTPIYFLRVVFLFLLGGFVGRVSLSRSARSPSKMTLACCSRLRSSFTDSLSPSIIALRPAASSR